MSQALTLEDKNRIELEIVNAITENPRLTMRNAARAAGISHTTLYKLMDQNKGFGERIRAAQKHARQAALDSLEEHLYERSEDLKNPTGCTSAIFLLKGNRAEYADRQPRGGGVSVVIQIDAEQVRLAAESTMEMRALEGVEGNGDEVELAPAAEDAWAVRN